MKITGAFKVLVPLIAGILLADIFRFNISNWLILVSMVIMLIFVLARKLNYHLSNIGFSISLLSFFILLGISFKNKTDSRQKETHFEHGINPFKPTYFEAKIIESPIQTANWLRCVAEVTTINNQACGGRLMLYIEKDSEAKIKYGDKLTCAGQIFEINPPKNPEEFNYKNFLARRDIHHQVFIKKENYKLAETSQNDILSWVYSIKERCVQLINDSPLNQENKSIIKALVLGDKSEISDETMMQFSITGTLHVLAVSGLHVGIVMMILNFIFYPIKRIKKFKWILPILVLFGIWFYATLTGFSPSVFRAAVMFSFVTIGSQFERDVSIYQSLTISAFILIIVNPNIIFELGFLLSYAAVIGIVSLYPLIYKSLYFRYKLADWVWKISAVSIAAQIATLPLSIYYFNNFPVYFLIANLLAIPAAFIILSLTISALILSFIPAVSFALFYIINLIGYVFITGINFIESLPYAALGPFKISLIQVIIAYVILTFAISKFFKTKIRVRMSLGLTLLFLSISIYHKWQLKTQNKIVIYSLKDANLIDASIGSSLYQFGDELATNEIDNYNFQIKNNRIATVRKTKADFRKLIENERTYSYKSKTIQFISYYNRSDGYLNPDIVYLFNCNYYPIEIIKKYSELNTIVVVGTGCDKKLIRILQKNIPKQNLFIPQQTGAMIFNWS